MILNGIRIRIPLIFNSYRPNFFQGASVCTSCPSGQYSASSGSLSCTDCPGGKAQSSSGQTSCTDCIAGTYASSAGRATSCTNCPKGMEYYSLKVFKVLTPIEGYARFLYFSVVFESSTCNRSFDFPYHSPFSHQASTRGMLRWRAFLAPLAT